MDPSELRMNLASLQRIDPFIKAIIMSSPQVSLKMNRNFGRKSVKKVKKWSRNGVITPLKRKKLWNQSVEIQDFM